MTVHDRTRLTDRLELFSVLYFSVVRRAFHETPAAFFLPPRIVSHTVPRNVFLCLPLLPCCLAPFCRTDDFFEKMIFSVFQSHIFSPEGKN